MGTSPDGVTNFPSRSNGWAPAPKTMKNQLTYGSYNSVYRGESQNEYGAFAV